MTWTTREKHRQLARRALVDAGKPHPDPRRLSKSEMQQQLAQAVRNTAALQQNQTERGGHDAKA